MPGKYSVYTNRFDRVFLYTFGIPQVRTILIIAMYYRDADDAVYARDGYDYDGYKLRVEFPRGGGGSFRGGRGDRGGGGYRGDRRPGPPARRSQYRVLVTGIYYICWHVSGISLAICILLVLTTSTFNLPSGLPPTGSWQDLKDHMREAGDVCFADVYKDGTGACEYVRYEDMKYALKKLDDTKFKSHEVSFQKGFFNNEYQC